MNTIQQKMLYLKVLLFSIALVAVALSIIYFPLEDGKKPQGETRVNTSSHIPPPSVKSAQNRDITMVALQPC
jgi:hypothetical protein